ncbi:MAG: VOC family protein [Hyphomicrobiales bacterium]|nr:VOC family protein [Hyphomicrobiales bacterium]MBV8825600.1 VOC family protein [Hyphomicrobiales bacterium]MBV9427598.1 VOC family protein [Bradyrhizobiaceae bacterium]
MIEVEQLRYVRLGTRDLPAATDFAQRILGLQLIEKNDEQATFRSDFRDHTLVYEAGDPAQQSVGLALRTEAALESAVAALAAHGITTTRADEAALRRRKARAMAGFRDRSGNTFELVVRPETSGWRYFPSRDAGVTGLAAVALRTTANGADEALWTTLFNGRVSDWVGDAAFIGFDEVHHRLALHPSDRAGVLAVEYAVESLNQVMQAMYFLQSAQVKIMHGPGRRPTSGQIFLTFAGPDDMLFSYVAEGAMLTDKDAYRPRQFPRKRRSFCAWGSESTVPEFTVSEG